MRCLLQQKPNPIIEKCPKIFFDAGTPLEAVISERFEGDVQAKLLYVVPSTAVPLFLRVQILHGAVSSLVLIPVECFYRRDPDGHPGTSQVPRVQDSSRECGPRGARRAEREGGGGGHAQEANHQCHGVRPGCSSEA